MCNLEDYPRLPKWVVENKHNDKEVISQEVSHSEKVGLYPELDVAGLAWGPSEKNRWGPMH